MRRLLSILVIISMLMLSSCKFSNPGITVEKTDDFIKITLDDFEGNQKINIKHEETGDCSLFYQINIEEGNINVSYKEGWIWDTLPLCNASTDTNTNGGAYIDSSTSTVTIILDSSEPTSGELLFCLSNNSSPFQ